MGVWDFSLREVLGGDEVGMGLREERGNKSSWVLDEVSIKGAGGDAEGRALGMLKINFVHCIVLAKVKIKSPFSKNCKSSFYSKDFLPWSCESLNTLPK